MTEQEIKDVEHGNGFTGRDIPAGTINLMKV